MINLTRRERDCLVVILSTQSEFPVRLAQIAKTLKVKAPTALDVIERLSKKKLVKDSGGMVVATEKGKEVYRRIMAAHRCFEILLTESGISPDEACKQVREFDYLIEPGMTGKVLKHIGNPKRCPHGKPVLV